MIGVVILIVLACIAAAIFMRQYRFNPAVMVAERLGLQAREVDPREQILIEPGPSMAFLSPMETFNNANLSDKINGKAELYLTAGFRELRSQRFKVGDLPDDWLEVFIYDMGRGLNAFSVFSTQRRDDAVTVALTPFSYRTSNAVFLVRGPYYVEIIASGTSTKLQNAMEYAAGAFIAKTRETDEEIAELKLFPDQGLLADTIRLIAANAFGFEGLDHVFMAEYRRGNQRLSAFLTRRDDPVQARELAQAYHDFLMAFGGKSLTPFSTVTGMKTVEIFNSYEVIFSKGTFLAGVHDAFDRRQAEALAQRLATKLDGESNAR